MALDHNRITQFIRDANEMVTQLGEYIAIPERDRTEEDNGEIRRLRVVAASLVAAADAVGRTLTSMPSPMTAPSVPPPVPSTPTPPTPPQSAQPAQTATRSRSSSG